MVKLTDKYLSYKVTGAEHFVVRKKNETDKQYLNRITHLYLQGQFIDHIAKIKVCQNVSVIYLQNNMLRTMDNLDSFPNLTHLYLQRNFLCKIDHLQSLKKLKKIYLGFNEILVLEGFADLTDLKEIHIESQDLPIGETLFFEPQTVLGLQVTLQVLDISNNNLSTLSDLRGLLRLEVLTANDNRLADLTDIINTLKEWPFLKSLSLFGNPVTEDRCYRDGIIFASKTLEVLDDKPVHENTRKFIEKLTERRKCITKKENDFPKKEKTEKCGKEKSVTFGQNSAVVEHLVVPEGSEDPTSILRFPAWQLRANVNPLFSKTFLPRPYWKKFGVRELKKSSTEK